MAPIIGITFSYDIQNDPENNYIRAVEEFHGIPRILYPGVSDAESADIDGLLLTGGGDIHPKFYNQECHPKVKFVDEARDKLELPLCQKAIETDLPVLGICRGIQMMSVAMRGSLYQDVPSQFTDPLEHPAGSDDDSYHEIAIKPDTLLNRIVGKQADKVNSSHHQSVDDIGEGFVVAAESADGVVEAIEIEDTSKRFVLGVQYHPERMLKTPELHEHRRKLFEAFIAAAATAKN